MTRKSIVKTGYFVFVLVFVAAIMRSTTLVAGAQAGRPCAWVCMADDNEIKVVDTATNTVVATIPVTLGSWPWHVTFSAGGRYAYVSCRDTDNVVVFDTNTRTEVGAINVGNGPKGLRATPDGAFVYVVNRYDDTVSVIRASDNTVVATIAVGDQPMAIAITPDGAYAYVTNRNDDTVSVVRLSDNTVVATIGVGNAPWGAAISPDGAYAYVSNIFDGTVSVIRTSDNTVVDTVAVGNWPQGLAVTLDGQYVYVPNNDPPYSVSVIRTSDNTVIATVAVHDEAWEVAITPDSAYAYVTNGDHTGEEGVEVIRISDNTVMTTINLGAGTYSPRGIAILQRFTLMVDKAGGGAGTVTSDPAGINCGADCTETYAKGTGVTLTAHPGVKSYLANWSGDCVSTGALTAQVTMNADKTCTATFGYPVGGIVVPVDKLGLLAPWMGVVGLVSLAALTVAVVRRRKP
jgi:YVTN family beta-propeller protein